MSEINTANVGKETQVGAFLVRGGALDVTTMKRKSLRY